MGEKYDIKEIVHQYFKPIFLAYDKDHNSSLEKEQLRQLLADNLGVSKESITNDQLDWHFEKIDQNKDGHITFQQYFGHFFGERAKANKKQSGQGQDDLIDIDQFRRLMQDTFKPLNITITQEMVSWNFNKIDTDGSGRISFEQYMKFIKKYNS